MSAASEERPRPKPVDECRNLYDVLEHARLRPAMFVGPAGALPDLMQWIGGYSAALTVHGLDEGFALGVAGPFTNWLSWNYGTSLSGGWVAAVEQLAQDGESSVEAFFRLLDAYRAESAAI